MTMLIIGFGYSARAFAGEWRDEGSRIRVTTRTPTSCERLLAGGWETLCFDGGTVSSALLEAMQETTQCLISAPPGEAGDPVLLSGLMGAARRLERVIYLSTVGVYGDHQGSWVDENTPLRPVSARSHQRVAVEDAWREAAKTHGFDLGIFRLSGIYGPGRSAIDNLRAGTARRIIKPGQVFNRIHVGDIAGALCCAFKHPGRLTTCNLTDDEPAPPEDVVTYAAGLLGMPPPPAVSFEDANLSEMGRSFYGEVKRVSNARLKHELGYALRFPSYREGLRACL